jgi:hypothetical protein
MRARRIDDNQSQIVKALRAVGCSVTSTAAMGEGFPDLAVGIHGKTYLMEVKDGDKPPSRQLLTTDELLWHNEWRGQVAIVTNVREALAVIGGQLQ